MSTPLNRAAYLTAKEEPLVISDAPYHSPKADQVTIRNHAVALNPVDPVLQQIGLFIYSWPHVLGCDSAGIVEEVGFNVTHVKKGDRVFARCSGKFGSNGFEDAEGFGGFQLYTLCEARFVGRIPDNTSFEDGSVFPLTTMTAAIGLFVKQEGRKFLGLDRPELKAGKKNDYVLIWGGSSSVGMCAIQLAIAAGYRVISTCSGHNAAILKELGVEETFDHKNDKIEEEIATWLHGRTFLGTLDAISRYGTPERCIKIAQLAPGNKKVVFVAPEAGRELPEDVISDVVFGNLDDGANEQLNYIFTEFLPAALEFGVFKAGKPAPDVVGHGLEYAQESLDRMSKGVSAKKLVITL